MSDEQDRAFMREAIRLAQQGMTAEDGGPFGAVVVRKSHIIGRGWNRVLATNDPTAHAEIVAIRDACARDDSYDLSGCRIYSSCEPCPMCLSAIYWANLDALIIGATRRDAAAVGFADEHLYREVCLHPADRTLSTGQCLHSEAVAVMKKWPELGLKKY